MPIIVQLPQVDESVTKGVIGKWLVSVGERVKKYDPIVKITTDKASMKVPAPYAGALTRIIAHEGEAVPMGQAIAELELEHEHASAALNAASESERFLDREEERRNRVGEFLVEQANAGIKIDPRPSLEPASEHAGAALNAASESEHFLDREEERRNRVGEFLVEQANAGIKIDPRPSPEPASEYAGAAVNAASESEHFLDREEERRNRVGEFLVEQANAGLKIGPRPSLEPASEHEHAGAAVNAASESDHFLDREEERRNRVGEFLVEQANAGLKIGPRPSLEPASEHEHAGAAVNAASESEHFLDREEERRNRVGEFLVEQANAGLKIGPRPSPEPASEHEHAGAAVNAASESEHFLDREEERRNRVGEFLVEQANAGLKIGPRPSPEPAPEPKPPLDREAERRARIGEFLEDMRAVGPTGSGEGGAGRPGATLTEPPLASAL